MNYSAQCTIIQKIRTQEDAMKKENFVHASLEKIKVQLMFVVGNKSKEKSDGKQTSCLGSFKLF
ncbi:CLUMA_CG008816, isoform A [Clunio marinus]|uniref:CLUMA_CG008816, isoform A n=1 Tax=Clunio marinus TaxID=568069 RepID=A0A1J1I4K2_9DIPT|nr:CLUMA_CG008816, isoform A [Clunio marinus]